MEDNKNTPQPLQESSGIIGLFEMWVLMFMFDGVQNTGRNLLIDVLKNDNNANVKELTMLLGVDEDSIRHGIGKIRNALKEQAENNGMSIEEMLGMFK